MGEIFCLYASDGVPRYIGTSEFTADKAYKRLMTEALELVPGKVQDWMRSVWQSQNEIECHILQMDVATSELSFYHSYWMAQFPKLLNPEGKGHIPTKTTEVGRKVIDGIRKKSRGSV